MDPLISLMQHLVNRFKEILETVRVFNTEVVTECINITVVALNRNGVLTANGALVHTTVFHFLVTELVAIQNAWDAAHGMPAKMKSMEDAFKTYFDNIFHGKVGKSLLVSSILVDLKLNWRPAFKEFFFSTLGQTLRAYPFINNFRNLMAHMDLDLAAVFPSASSNSNSWLKKMTDNLRDPQKHRVSVQARLLSSKLDTHIQGVWEYFLQELKNCFFEAAKEAIEQTEEPTKKFMEVLNEKYKLVSVSLGHGMSVSYSSLFEACDKNAKETFGISNTSDSFLWNALIEQFETQASKAIQGELNIVRLPQPSILSGVCLAEDMIERLKLFPKGPDSALSARCGEPCPICRCPCELEQGHSILANGTPGKLHNTCHQPNALTGWHHTKSEKLEPRGCAALVNTNHLFKRSEDTEYRPYSNWDIYFPDWTRPIDGILPLHLREYIVHTYNEHLAKFYGYKPAENVPAQYAHDLESVVKDLRNIAGLEDFPISKLCRAGCGKGLCNASN